MAPSSHEVPYPVVGNEACIRIEGEGYENSTTYKGHGAHSTCTTSFKVNCSANPRFFHTQEIGVDEPQNPKLNKPFEYRILIIVWICYFWDRQLEGVLVRQNMPVDRALGREWSNERHDMKSAVLAFYIGRAIGVWLASMAIMMEEFARVIPTSLFLTGLFATLLNFYSGGESSARTVCYFLCAVSSSPLMPAVILLTHLCYSKLTQPLRTIIWATAGPVAIFIGEMNLHLGGNKGNMPISVAGIMLATLSLMIEPWMARIKSSSAPWFLSQREIATFDTEEHPSNWSRFQELWRLYKSEIWSSFLDPQLYFFLGFAIADASCKREFNELLEWKFADAFAQASPLVSYILAGVIVYFCTKPGCVTVLMVACMIMEMAGWWHLSVCYRPDSAETLDRARKCTAIFAWAVSLLPAVGELSITWAVILLVTNIRGGIRSFFIVATFCFGCALGGLTRTLLTLQIPIDQWHRWVTIATVFKLASLCAYVIWIIAQNRKRRARGSEEIIPRGGPFEWRGASAEHEKTDIQSEDFIYIY